MSELRVASVLTSVALALEKLVNKDTPPKKKKIIIQRLKDKILSGLMNTQFVPCCLRPPQPRRIISRRDDKFVTASAWIVPDACLPRPLNIPEEARREASLKVIEGREFGYRLQRRGTSNNVDNN